MAGVTPPATIAAGPRAWTRVPEPQRGDIGDGRDPAHPLAGQGGMVPAPDLLPDALPTDRLTADARPLPELRPHFRRTHGLRNALNVVSVWLQSFGVIAVACWLTTRWPLAVT